MNTYLLELRGGGCTTHFKIGKKIKSQFISDLKTIHPSLNSLYFPRKIADQYISNGFFVKKKKWTGPSSSPGPLSRRSLYPLA